MVQKNISFIKRKVPLREQEEEKVMRVGISILWVWICASQLYAQSDTLAGEQREALRFSSPYLSLRAFLEVLNRGDEEVARVAPLFSHPLHETESRIRIAWQLKQVLDGTGEVIYLEEVPRLPNYRDTTNGLHRYVLVDERPRIYLERQESGAWHFPPRAVDKIIEWHEEVFPWGIDNLLRSLPLLGERRVGGLYLWQILSLLALIMLSALLHKALTMLTQRIARRVLLRYGLSKIAGAGLLPMMRPMSWIWVFGLLLMALPVLQLPVQIAHYLILGIRIMLPVFFTVMLYHLVDILYAYSLKWVQKTPTKLDDQLVLLLRKVLKVFVVTLGALFVLDYLSIPILPLLTGLSIGGLAFALAAQDTIKNFFSSLTIFIDRPFQIGDWITCGEVDGVVEEIGLRSTRVRTFRYSLIYVPNAQLADSMLDNHTLRKYRRYYTRLHLSLDTSTSQLEAFVEGLKGIIEAHPQSYKESHEIHLHEITRAGLVVMFYVFVRSSDWSGELRARHELNICILRLAESLNIAFTYEANTALSGSGTPRLPSSVQS